MTLAVLDAPTGLAGNMLLAALLDVGVPEAVVTEPLSRLGLEGRYRLVQEERRSGGLRGRHLNVELLEHSPAHRRWGGVREQLMEVDWPENLRQRVLDVFTLLAEAEAAVHGHSPEQVHFHEVGALDSLVDVVGVCAGLLHLGVERLVCTAPPAGHGSVCTAHGALPVPVPAVLEIARRCSIPLASSEGFPAAELTTPTGLALMACWAERFGVAPSLVPEAIGIGLGSHPLDRPNLLRLVLAAGAAESAADPALETVLLQQAQLDDATPEDLAFLADELRQAGALEVFSESIAMKKGRSGTLLTVIARADAGQRLRRIWWRHGTSLGIREQWQQRWVLQRRSRVLDTPMGPVRIKESLRPEGGWQAKPEHDDLVTLARRLRCPIGEVRERVMRAWRP
ncbi:MAG: nickel pincer cofactor biosynthesis protein LarC [Cyanobacteriota bacterium]|nr:nickel pincer cofactor biosynthesis protein LarC [Cyanobacteriota bacterium]